MRKKKRQIDHTKGYMQEKIQRVVNNKERGQGLVEFAFSLVLLLTLIVGIVDLSRALFTYMAIRDAAEEGALVASIAPDDLDKVRERVINSSSLVAGSMTLTGKTPYKRMGRSFFTWA